jgi:hypothetical protein
MTAYLPNENSNSMAHYWNSNNEDEDSDSDPESREIDYPDTPTWAREMEDDESNESDPGYYENHPMDDDSDMVFAGNANLPTFVPNGYQHPGPYWAQQYHPSEPDYPSTVFTETVECSVCAATCAKGRFSWSDMDHYVTAVENNVALSFPCNDHYVCCGCIKKALKVNGTQMLREGHGSIPCPGDAGCTNALNERTTVMVRVFMDLFPPAQWRQMQAQWKAAQGAEKVQNYHPHVPPIQSKNINLDVSVVCRHLKSLLDCDNGPKPLCFVCETAMEKSVACNALRHCDHEVCWMCGYSTRRLDPTHWHQCCHFDTDQRIIDLGYLCKEGYCFDEHNHCTKNEHAEGRKAYEEFRKAKFIQGLWKSLDDATKDGVLRMLSGVHTNLLLRILNSEMR